MTSSPVRASDEVGGKLLVGVDGGGSKTAARVAVLRPDGVPETIGEGYGGPSNVRSVGAVHATTNLDVAIDAAFGAAGAEPGPADVAVLALAGSLLSDVRATISDWADRRRLAARVEIVHDAEPVLALSAPDGRGVALIVGTGSVALGSDTDGRRSMSGGWGHWFGDVGSGFDLGRQALASVAAAADGLGPGTVLERQIVEALRADGPRDIVKQLHAMVDIHREIASIGRLVLDAAVGGDAVAMSLVENAAAATAALAVAAARKLDLEGSVPLGLAGGIACSSELYREQVVARIRESGLRPDPVTVVAEPVEGTIRLARDFCVSGATAPL